MRQIDLKKDLSLFFLLALLTGLILCPLLTVFAKAVIVNGRLDLYRAWAVVASTENVQTVCNSLLLGVCVVLCSTVIAVPTAYLLARTQLKKHSWLDIIFMIPFMTPPYIASMGWILFMQKKGLFQQLFPATGAWSEGFFCFGGLVLVMSLHVFPFLIGSHNTYHNLRRKATASFEEGEIFWRNLLLFSTAQNMQSEVVFDCCRLFESGPETLALVKRLMVKCYPDECLVDEETAAYGKTMQMYEITIEHLSGKKVQER